MAKKKILFVDDEINLTKMIKLNLESTNLYEVRTENCGSQALNTAKTFKPDLIFLDIIMPDIEGSEVARQIQEDQELKNTPIVFLTATITQDEVKESGGVIGDQSFLAKPVHVQQIVECIEKRLKK